MRRVFNDGLSLTEQADVVGFAAVAENVRVRVRHVSAVTESLRCPTRRPISAQVRPCRWRRLILRCLRSWGENAGETLTGLAQSTGIPWATIKT
jgi:hypothetical protein